MMAAICLTSASFAQQDSAYTKTDTVKKNDPDTIRVGNFVIVKQKKEDKKDEKDKSFSITIRSRWNTDHDTATTRKKSTFSTNWLIFDLGFANINDKTSYTTANAGTYLNANGGLPFTKSDLKMRTKSSNVNVWLFMQKLNITKHVINLKYGLGFEMFNYRYDNDISYHKNPAYIFRDTIQFSKNKLYAGYATVPFMININPWPNKKRISLSAGVSAGYLVGSHTKQISDERGKDKTRSDFDLEKWRLAYIGELSLGPVRLYGSYSIQPLHERDLKQYPYTIGVRFSNW